MSNSDCTTKTHESPNQAVSDAAKVEARAKYRQSEIEELRRRLADLANLIDWLEQNEDAPVPTPFSINTLNAFVDAEGFSRAAKAIGSFRKNANDTYFTLEKKFGSVEYHVNAGRANVCEKIEEEVEVPEQVIPATVIPAHVKKVVKWICPESLLAEEGAGAA